MKRYLKNPYLKKCPSEIRPLMYSLNALSGIKLNSWVRYDKKYIIFFNIDNKDELDVKFGDKNAPLSQGLFLLTRSIDRRYFNMEVDIRLSVADLYEDKILPTVYELHIEEDEQYTIQDKVSGLVDNMNFHLNNSSFVDYYEIDLSLFHITDQRTERSEKISTILNG